MVGIDNCVETSVIERKERASMGVGIRGLSGITDDFPPDTLVSVDNVSEFSPPLSTQLTSVDGTVPLEILPVLLPLLSIPVTGLERVEWLCFSRHRQWVREVWSKTCQTVLVDTL